MPYGVDHDTHTLAPHGHRIGHHEQHDGTALDEGEIVPVVGFDYSEIDRRLGWREPKPPAEVRRDRAFEQGAELLSAILIWLARSKTNTAMLGRANVLLLVLKPELLPVASYTAVARRLRCTKQLLSRFARELHQLAGGRFQRHQQMKGAAWRRRCRARALQHHRAAGHGSRPEKVHFRCRIQGATGQTSIFLLRQGETVITEPKASGLVKRLGPVGTWTSPFANFHQNGRGIVATPACGVVGA